MCKIRQILSMSTLVYVFDKLRCAIENPLGLALLYGALLYWLSLYSWLMMVVLAASIFIHEFGHWFAARKQNFPVEIFSCGLPSKYSLHLFSAWLTRFQITPYWFFGGFIALDPEDEKSRLRRRGEKPLL